MVSRADLMAQVWDDPKNTYSNIIDVYASRIRRKLDEGEVVPMFTTLRGTGFILQPPPHPAAATAATRTPRRRGARRTD